MFLQVVFETASSRRSFRLRRFAAQSASFYTHNLWAEVLCLRSMLTLRALGWNPVSGRSPRSRTGRRCWRGGDLHIYILAREVKGCGVIPSRCPIE